MIILMNLVLGMIWKSWNDILGIFCWIWWINRNEKLIERYVIIIDDRGDFMIQSKKTRTS